MRHLILNILLSFGTTAFAGEMPRIDEINSIIQKQFNTEFTIPKLNPSFVLQKMQADGREDLVVVVSANPRSGPAKALPESIYLANPFPSRDDQPSYWNEFISGKLNAIAIIHANESGKFDDPACKKYLLLGPSAMTLSSPRIAGDSMMNQATYHLKTGKKIIKLPSIEFSTLLDKGWIYWKDGAYHWDESQVYD